MPRPLNPKPYNVSTPYSVVCYGGDCYVCLTETEARRVGHARDDRCCDGCTAAVAHGYHHRVVRLDAVDLPYEAPKAAKREEAGDGE